MSAPGEKRRHPRIAQRVPVRSEESADLRLETVDLSAGGLCCTASKHIPPMTRMALTLVLPPNAGKTDEEHLVSGEAVVVRSERSSANGGGYRIALFFSRMDDADRQALLGFLKRRSR